MARKTFLLKFAIVAHDRVVPYQLESPAMALCRETSEGHMSLLRSFLTCREEVAKPLWIWYNSGSINRQMGNGLCLAVRLSAQLKTAVYSKNGEFCIIRYKKLKLSSIQNRIVTLATIGKTLLNLLEKDLGWPLTTVAYGKFEPNGKTKSAIRLTHGDQDYVHKVALFFSCDKWRMSPSVFSLYALLGRAGVSNKLRGIKSLDDMIVKITSAGLGDSRYYRHVRNWLNVLRNTDKLFDEVYSKNWRPKDFNTKKSRGYNYNDLYNIGYYPITEGIQQLVTLSSDNDNLVKKFKSIIEDKNPKVKNTSQSKAQ